MYNILLKDKWMTMNQITSQLEINIGSVHSILTNDSHMHKVCIKIVPSFFLYHKFCNMCSITRIGSWLIISLIGSVKDYKFFRSMNMIWKPRNKVGNGRKMGKYKRRRVKKSFPNKTMMIGVFNRCELVHHRFVPQVKLSMFSFPLTC